MVPVLALWLPILLSAVLVFVASSVIHMLLGYHADDFRQVPAEDAVMEDLRRVGIPPGDYVIPRASSMKEMSSPEYVEKMKRGPVALLSVASGPPSLQKNLAQWFVYSLVVGIFAAYVSGRALGPGAGFWEVFRFATTTAFLGYALALWQESIWYFRSWKPTLKSTFDGAVYAALTGAVFGWLWPV
jgi:hypothetical protein